VLLSVINALTLSPALRRCSSRPSTGKRSLLTPFYNGFNTVFGWTTDAYVSFSAILIRKSIRSLAFVGVLIYVIVVLVRQIPGGFVPKKIRATCWSTRCCPTRHRSSVPTP
jgi:multidrug efflux pump subunit AcrB